MQNKKLPLVTVIVPFYNEEKHIEQCFQTLRIQTYSNIEIIAIDDGSTDNSRKIAKKYVDILLKQKHQGPGVARNKAARIAKGKILVFADADMYFDENYIKMLVKPIIEKKAFATFTNEEKLANRNNIWVKCGNIDNQIPSKLRFRKSTMSFVARAILKKLFIKLGGMKPHLGYRDDHLFVDTDYRAIPTKSAICYHFNPSTLMEVYFSARWNGKSPAISTHKINLLRFSIINSFIISFQKILKGAPLDFLIYKIFFDFGIFTGILLSKCNNYAK